MTKKDLEKFGVIHIRKNVFFIPYLGEVELHEPYQITEIFKLMYEKGKINGIEIGKKMKISELKSILEIKDEDQLL